MTSDSQRLSAGSGIYPITAFAIVFGAAVLRFWGLDGGLPHLMTRPDEELIVLQTRLPAMGNFFLEWPGQHPGIPSAYIYLLWAWGEVGLRVLQIFGAAPAGDYLTVLNQAPDRLLLTERFFSASAGTATVAVLMWVVRREFGTRAALIAGLILATSVFHVRDSHSAKSDVALGLFSILSLGLLAPLARDLSRRGACGAGLAIGMAMAMKLPGVLLLLPAWLACMQGSGKRGWRRIFPAEIFWITGIAGLFFALTSPDFLLNEETLNKILQIPVLAFSQLASPADVPLGDAGLPEVARPSIWGGVLYHYQFSLRYGLGWALMVLFPAALIWGVASQQPLARLGALLFFVFYIAFAPSHVMLSRYMTPVLPVAALLIAGALVALVDRLRFFSSPARQAVLAIVAVVLVYEPLQASVRFDRLMSTTDTRVSAEQWLAENTEVGDRVALAGASGWFWGDPQVPAGRAIARPAFESGGLPALSADFLVVHDHPLFSSTADWAAVDSLGARLQLVAEIDPFRPGDEPPVFERQDAFYFPTRGYAAVSAPGPMIRIYKVLSPGPR